MKKQDDWYNLLFYNCNEFVYICFFSRKHFQFGWTGSTDIANSVAMETLALPNLLVINATSYQVQNTWILKILSGLNYIKEKLFQINNLMLVTYYLFQHYLPYDEPAHLTIEAIQIFLDDILAGTAPVYGGSSYSVR